jgi:hypothetical protein
MLFKSVKLSLATTSKLLAAIIHPTEPSSPLLDWSAIQTTHKTAHTYDGGNNDKF